MRQAAAMTKYFSWTKTRAPFAIYVHCRKLKAISTCHFTALASKRDFSSSTRVEGRCGTFGENWPSASPSYRAKTIFTGTLVSISFHPTWYLRNHWNQITLESSRTEEWEGLLVTSLSDSLSLSLSLCLFICLSVSVSVSLWGTSST